MRARRACPPRAYLAPWPPQAADNSKLVVDKIRVEVRKAQMARNLSDEQTMQLFQQNFEHSLDQLIGAIRNSFNVSRRPARVPHRLSPNRCRSSRWAGAPYCGSTHHSS